MLPNTSSLLNLSDYGTELASFASIWKGAAVLAMVFLGQGGVLSTAAFYMAFPLLVLANAQDGKRFLRFCLESPWAWLVAVLTLYVCTRTLLAQEEFPENAEAIGKRGGQLIMVAGLPALFLAWHLARAPGRLILLVTAYLVSLVAFFFLEGGWSTLAAHLNEDSGFRLQFGGHNNAIGALYGGGIIASLFLVTETVNHLNGPQSPQRRALWTGILILLVAASTLFLLTVLWNQSRTAWVALFAALIPPLGYFSSRLLGRHKPSRHALTIALITLLLGGIAFQNTDLLDKRFGQALEELEGIRNIQVDERGQESVGKRIRLFMAGATAVAERPWWGWGPDHYDAILTSAGAKDLQGLGHFHNFYLQIATAFGLVGLIGFLAVFLLPLRYLWVAHRRKWLPPGWILFALSSWVYLMALGLATIRHDDPEGQAYYVLVLGIAALTTAQRCFQKEGEQACP